MCYNAENDNRGKKWKSLKFNTALLHKNNGGDQKTGATLTPIYQVSAFSQDSAEQLERVFNNKAPGFAYSRISNPTVAAFENRISALEKGIGAVACSSGMAAVTIYAMANRSLNEL